MLTIHVKFSYTSNGAFVCRANRPMGVHPRRFVTISGYGESRESVADACVIAYCRKYGFDAQFREFTRISTPDGYIYADRPKARLKIRTMTKSTQELLAVRQ